MPLGFPIEVGLAGTVAKSARHEIDTSAALPGTVTTTVTLYPSPLATMTKGAEGLLREPGGCFEQTSSSNYPNVMAIAYLQENDVADPETLDRASGMLDRGYHLLAGYETKEKGYEWFGEAPGHEALTAYGLMEFVDMQGVWSGVDRGMVDRTADWLLARRDGKGGFVQNPRALDSFGRASAETTSAYIVWALAEAKRAKGLDVELAAQRKRGLESTDPYLVALAANTLELVEPGAGTTAAVVRRLVGMQAKDGSFPGAAESITRSGSEALTVETTALAVLALVKASPGGEQEGAIRSGVAWLDGHRGGWGAWDSTQATILALKAETAYARHSRATAAAGTVTILVDGKEAGKVAFEKGRREAIVLPDLPALAVPGKHSVEIRLDSPASLPYTLAVGYRSARPATSPRAPIGLTTSLAKREVKQGEGVRLTAVVENRAKDGVPMTLARIGIPGGLTAQTWQLKELKDKGVVDFVETRPREVIVYFRALPGGERRTVDLDLIAATPGTYVAPASSAYLYYTPEDKAWVAPVDVQVVQ